MTPQDLLNQIAEIEKLQHEFIIYKQASDEQFSMFCDAFIRLKAKYRTEIEEIEAGQYEQYPEARGRKAI